MRNMVERWVACVGGCGPWVLVAVLLGGGGAASYGQEPSGGPSLTAYLESGEFAAARELVRQQSDPAVRDRWLGEIAVAQSRVGARRAAWATAAEISSDVVRGQTLEASRATQFGGPLARGGAALADFDTLIELITSTIAPDTWDEVGGPGAIEPFPTGVLVDAGGELRRTLRHSDEGTLGELRRRARQSQGNYEVRRASPLRKVSLARLEKQAQLLAAAGRSPDETMRCLAGLYRVQFVFLFPETRDIVLAGPAGDWQPDAEGRITNVDTQAPVLHLDDLVVTLRAAYGDEPRFGCAITPTAENLAAVQNFLRESAGKPVRPLQRERWVTSVREKIGLQDVKVFGIDPRTRAARVLVEADYHMKQIGMGLEAGTLGVDSYLELVRASGQPPKSMSVLRWWFTANYDAVRTTSSRDAFEIQGLGVRVQSENELLTRSGQRVHTGTADALNQEFADNFTRHFAALAQKYPVYADLRNLFDLALVAALLRHEDLPGQVDWHLTHFGRDGDYALTLDEAPRKVESIVNHVSLDRQQFLVGVSGGVSVDVRSLVERRNVRTDDYGLLQASRAGAAPAALPSESWWWD